MATGTVSTIDLQGGHGTITPDSLGEPLFFVQDIARRPLAPGERVTYSIQITPHGVIARDIRPTPIT